MKTKIKITNGVKSAVNAYLMARTLAECEREKVDKIADNLLATANYQGDKKCLKRHNLDRILKNKDSWMLEEKEHSEFLLDLKFALQKSGYKIESIPNEPEHSYKCPALTAESLQREAGWLVVDATAEMIGEKSDFRDRLLCSGLDNYCKFIDLAVKMVVSSPGYKNPLT